MKGRTNRVWIRGGERGRVGEREAAGGREGERARERDSIYLIKEPQLPVCVPQLREFHLFTFLELLVQ